MQRKQETSVSVLLTIPQVCQKLGVGRTKFYRLIEVYGLPTLKVGNARRIVPESLDRWIKEQEQCVR
ncbi:MAG TPA: helix-turn-helix domain-containing protein [Ktedonobacteraceae bacterium]|nr:helix-turn-helix domain-containing protein [Ktedonobacteraceae bacterium]